MTTANRVINRLLSALLGLVLLVAGLAGVIEVLVSLFGGAHFVVPTDKWLATLRSTPWNAESVVLVSTIVVVVGIVLIISGVAARARIIGLRKPKDTVEVVASARAVAQILRRQAESVSGVASASSEVSARGARVVADVPMADPQRIEVMLSQVLSETMRKIPWTSAPTLRVEVSSGQPKDARGPSRVAVGGRPAEERDHDTAR
ncbi:hypothetical protein CLV47_102391 [Antricoccus suffuscus]|uniref:DUF6286 domain-containing protein n=1 Tax=Antricoccus suffuscus TaxID=1629062 RepID=A0A2T1A526_9ACTN|nr:DUF6286 domain-containing protein [Antricoccus suffuscus]PRZ43700.1 hypothetical protein CLV47_102391 [Antricoccus suffuscus]